MAKKNWFLIKWTLPGTETNGRCLLQTTAEDLEIGNAYPGKRIAININCGIERIRTLQDGSFVKNNISPTIKHKPWPIDEGDTWVKTTYKKGLEELLKELKLYYIFDKLEK